MAKLQIPTEQIVYLCDPKKNKDCPCICCYKANLHPEYGECRWTHNPKYAKDNKKYWFNPETMKHEEVKQ